MDAFDLVFVLSSHIPGQACMCKWFKRTVGIKIFWAFAFSLSLSRRPPSWSKDQEEKLANIVQEFKENQNYEATYNQLLDMLPSYSTRQITQREHKAMFKQHVSMTLLATKHAVGS